jgi:hypothetical protein
LYNGITPPGEVGLNEDNTTYRCVYLYAKNREAMSAATKKETGKQSGLRRIPNARSVGASTDQINIPRIVAGGPAAARNVPTPTQVLIKYT